MFTDIFKYAVVQIIITIAVTIIIQTLIRSSLNRMVRRAVRGHRYAHKIDEEKRERTLTNIFHTASSVAIWTIAAVIILGQLNVNLAALLTGAGLIGIVVGFGAQNAIKDFLAGIFIIAENQYRVGDIVTLRTAGTDVSGMVEDITVRITRLRDLDGNMHIVQNGAPQVVTNLSFEYANVNVDIRVAYDTDIDKVEAVINEVGEAIKQSSKWGEFIMEPIQFLRVDAFEDYSILVKALGKVAPAQQWDVTGEFRREILKAFKKHHIQIPLPQLDVLRRG